MIIAEVTTGSILLSVALTAVATGLSYLATTLLAPSPKKPNADHTPTVLTTRGSYLPMLIGRRRIGYVFAWAGERRTSTNNNAITYYEAGWHIICTGPGSALYRIFSGGTIIWDQKITPTDTPSGTSIHVLNYGDFTIYWGECDQPVNTYLGQTSLNTKTGAPRFPGINSRWPHCFYVVWTKFKIGYAPLWPQIEYEVEVQPHSTTTTLVSSTPWIPEQIVANPVDGTTAWWNGKASMPAGNYIITYVNGAMKYAANDGWRVGINSVIHWQIVDVNGNFFRRIRCSEGSYKTQADCESANASFTDTFYWPGGPMGLRFVNSNYTHTVPGSPNPTYSIALGPTNWTVTGVVQPNEASINGTADDGANPAHVLWQVLTAKYPHGAGLDPSNLDYNAFEALGVAMQNERLSTSFWSETGEGLGSALEAYLTECGIMMPQIGSILSPRAIRPVLSGVTVPTIPDSAIVENRIEVAGVCGLYTPNRTTFTLLDRTYNFASNTINLDDDGLSVSSNRVQDKQIDLKAVIDRRTGNMVALRRLAELTVNTQLYKFTGQRDVRNLHAGDPFIIPEFGQMRVTSTELDMATLNINVEALLDQFSDVPPNYVPSDLQNNAGIYTYGPNPDDYFVAFKLPSALCPTSASYFSVLRVNYSGESTVAANILLSSNGGTVYQNVGIQPYLAVSGTLNRPMVSTEGPTTITLDIGFTPDNTNFISSVLDLTGDTANYNDGLQLCLIDNELFLLQSITAESGGYQLIGLKRAQYGTTATDHAYGARIWIFLKSQLSPIQSNLLTSGSTLYVESQPFDVNLATDVSLITPYTLVIP